MRGASGGATETYLAHKEEILRVFGARLWPEAEVAEQRGRMKGAMNALDNDGGLSAWAKRHPSTTVKSLAMLKERLSARGVVFAPSQYKKEQEAGTTVPCTAEARKREHTSGRAEEAYDAE